MEPQFIRRVLVGMTVVLSSATSLGRGERSRKVLVPTCDIGEWVGVPGLETWIIISSKRSESRRRSPWSKSLASTPYGHLKSTRRLCVPVSSLLSSLPDSHGCIGSDAFRYEHICLCTRQRMCKC